MTTYIVVTDPFDADVVRAMLPPALIRATHLVVGGGASSSISLARSLVSDRGEPLLLVMNTDTVHHEAIREQEHEVRDLLGAVAIDTPYDVVLAIPELEIVFFHDLDVLANALQMPLDHDIAVRARYEPRHTLTSLWARSPHPIHEPGQFLDLFDSRARQRIAQHPLLQQITDFVAHVEARALI